MKKTLILGASTNPERYSYKAAERLVQNGYEIVPVGIKEGKVQGVEILKTFDGLKDVDTVTMYVGARNQEQYAKEIVKLNPRRVIFNPGAENDELSEYLESNNIETENACTLVLLSLGQY